MWDYGAADQFTGQRNWLYASDTLRAERDPFLLAASADLRGLQFYIDVGANDALRVQDEALHRLLLGRGAASEWHVGSGGPYHGVLERFSADMAGVLCAGDLTAQARCAGCTLTDLAKPV